MSRKKRAALVAAAMTAAVASGAWANSYEFHIAEIIDSDTYRGAVTLWPGMTLKVDIRVNGIDTPEKFRPDPACKEHERALAKKAAEFVTARIHGADRILVTRPFPGKYAGRVVADVLLVKGDQKTSISVLLIESGLAVEYDGGKKTKNWCEAPA